MNLFGLGDIFNDAEQLLSDTLQEMQNSWNYLAGGGFKNFNTPAYGYQQSSGNFSNFPAPPMYHMNSSQRYTPGPCPPGYNAHRSNEWDCQSSDSRYEYRPPTEQSQLYHPAESELRYSNLVNCKGGKVRPWDYIVKTNHDWEYYNCIICGCDIYSYRNADQHANGSKHAFALEEYGCDIVVRGRNSYYCRVCDCSIYSYKNVYQHIMGYGHQSWLHEGNFDRHNDPGSGQNYRQPRKISTSNPYQSRRYPETSNIRKNEDYRALTPISGNAAATVFSGSNRATTSMGNAKSSGQTFNNGQSNAPPNSSDKSSVAQTSTGLHSDMLEGPPTSARGKKRPNESPERPNSPKSRARREPSSEIHSNRPISPNLNISGSEIESPVNSTAPWSADAPCHQLPNLKPNFKATWYQEPELPVAEEITTAPNDSTSLNLLTYSQMCVDHRLPQSSTQTSLNNCTVPRESTNMNRETDLPEEIISDGSSFSGNFSDGERFSDQMSFSSWQSVSAQNSSFNSTESSGFLDTNSYEIQAPAHLPRGILPGLSGEQSHDNSGGNEDGQSAGIIPQNGIQGFRLSTSMSQPIVPFLSSSYNTRAVASFPGSSYAEIARNVKNELSAEYRMREQMLAETCNEGLPDQFRAVRVKKESVSPIKKEIKIKEEMNSEDDATEETTMNSVGPEVPWGVHIKEERVSPKKEVKIEDMMNYTLEDY